MTNYLAQYSEKVTATIAQRKAQIDAAHSALKPVRVADLELTKLTARIAALLGLSPSDLDVSFLDRKKFQSDIAIRIPSLLKSKPTPVYIKEDVPRFVAALEPLKAQGLVEKIENKGIYLNLALTQEYLFGTQAQVRELGARFGTGDEFTAKTFAVDYSSPNVAKHLHAGHIRGTLLGQVLCNLYEANGAKVYRINYINDWGGFGEIIEGYLNWKEALGSFAKPNDLLFAVYQNFRTAEKASTDAAEFSALSAEQKTRLEKTFGSFSDQAQLKELFLQFKTRARTRFHQLESGEKETVTLWAQMVQWSLEDFAEFYGLLKVQHDFVFGESYYVDLGRKVVEQGLKAGTIVRYTPELAAKDRTAIEAAIAAKTVPEAEGKTLIEDLECDTGAFVVPLDNYRRMVIQRGDESTIYATRDSAGIVHRAQQLGGTDLVYVVGQEQSDHFAQVFASAQKLGSLSGKPTRCEHIYFGFYIDSTNKKKLSSRKGASSVTNLLNEAVRYFKAKYKEKPEFAEAECSDIAGKLAVGSILYNDLKKDKKLAVELNPDPLKMIEEFERSGGAYVIYTVCRARSVLRKAGEAVPEVSTVSGFQLAEIERELLKLCLDMPRRVANAARNENPAILITFIEELASLYNSYYHDYPVVKGGERNLHRMVITQTVMTTLENALRICHIECPERI